MKIEKLTDLLIYISKYKRKKNKIVLCHGDFDTFHYGHLKHLEAAKKYGDKLIVSITSDKFVSKGFNRPVFNENQRAEIISNMNFVDHVYIDDNKTAEKIISYVKPNFFVKGSDYKSLNSDFSKNILKEKKLVEKFGGNLVFTNEAVFSSSKIINHSKMNNSLLKKLLKLKKKYSINKINKIINQISKLKILIIGDTIIDEYIYVSKLGKPSKEDIIASLYNRKERSAGGLFAGVNILSKFSNNIDFLTVINKNDLNFIKKSLPTNINKKIIFFDDRPTTTKTRFVQDSYFKIKKIYEYYTMDDTPIKEKVEKKVLSQIKKNIKKYDIVIVNDYGHGLMTKKIINSLSINSKFLAVSSQINAGNEGFNLVTKYKKADYCCVDQAEALKALEDKFIPDKEIAKNLLRKIGCKNVCVTMGTQGSYMSNRKGQVYKFYSITNNVADTISAGDAFLSVSSPVMFISNSLELSSLLGNLAGAIEVSIPGPNQFVDKSDFISNLNTLLKI